MSGVLDPTKKGTSYKKGSRDFGDVGEMRVVKIADLKIDHLYQRDLIAAVVEKIARDYDIVTAGTIVVSERDSGELFIVDGQHRTAGALRAGETEILAQVLTGMSAEDEARLRLQGNFKRTDTIYENFRARLFANDEVALGMRKIAELEETQFNMAPNESAHGINAIASAEAIYRSDGTGQKLREVLNALRQAFGALDSRKASSANMKGIAWFLDRHDAEIDRERFFDRLRLQGTAALHRMAVNHKAAMGGAMWLNVYRAMVEVYNHGLQDKNRLEWRTNRATVQYKGEGPHGREF